MRDRKKMARGPVDPASGLTERQAFLVRIIHAHLMRRARPPVWRTMRETMGGVSPNGLRCHLDALERKGWIARSPQRDQPDARGHRLRVAIGHIALAGVAMTQSRECARHFPAIDCTPEGLRLALLLCSPLGRKAAQP